jgi:hypothetical protein
MKSPDCRDGKHLACTHENAAWNGEAEQTVDCGCGCHEVPRD